LSGRNFEQDSFEQLYTLETDVRIGDVIVPTNPEDQPGCCTMDRLNTLNEIGSRLLQ